MYKILFLGILFLSQPVFSGEIADTYQKGAFGTKWGDTMEDLKKSFPRGKRENYKEVIMYITRDGRPVFDIERKKNSLIIFGFNLEKKLNSIAVDFQMQDYSKLLKNLDAKFGSHVMKSDNSTARIAVWPQDNGVELSLTMARAGFFSQEIKTSFNIIYTGANKKD